MSAHPDAVSARLPDYDIQDEIGRGEFGIVWRGRHRQLQRDVVIKQFAGSAGASAEYGARFRREASILAQLDHRHVVTVHDYREQGELRLLIMEFLAGGTFADRRRTGLSVETAIASVIAARGGLQYVHDHGILHRDVKPENLMFDGRGTMKVTDFGIARGDYSEETAVNLTRRGRVLRDPGPCVARANRSRTRRTRGTRRSEVRSVQPRLRAVPSALRPTHTRRRGRRVCVVSPTPARAGAPAS